MEPDAKIASFDVLDALNAAIELALLTRLEQIEGRVPTNPEVAAHARQTIFPSGVCEFSWRGQTIVRVVPYDEWPSSGWRIVT